MNHEHHQQPRARARRPQPAPIKSGRTRDFYKELLGHPHRGLEYLLNHDPETLKRYRPYSDTCTPDNYESNRELFVFGFLHFYALIGYDGGVRYVLRTRQRLGMTKAQIFEGLAIVFLVMGPTGSRWSRAGGLRVDRARAGRSVPDGWAPDPAAFHSGLDFENPDLTPAEMTSLKQWYLDVLHKVRPYVSFLLEHRPRMIKAYRSRFETCAKVLPKQTSCQPPPEVADVGLPSSAPRSVLRTTVGWPAALAIRWVAARPGRDPMEAGCSL